MGFIDRRIGYFMKKIDRDMPNMLDILIWVLIAFDIAVPNTISTLLWVLIVFKIAGLGHFSWWWVFGAYVLTVITTTRGKLPASGRMRENNISQEQRHE
jgi:hypothetical protein